MGAGALPDRRRHALARPRRAHLHAVGRLAGAADGGRAGAGRRRPARPRAGGDHAGLRRHHQPVRPYRAQAHARGDRPRPRRARPLQEPRRCASRRRLRRGDHAHHARQHERRRAALRGRRPLGLPEQGDGAPARHAGRGAEGAADLQGHHPPSRAARRLWPARDAARRPGGLDRQPHRALQPAGPAGRAAAHHHRPHRRGDLPDLARRPRAHRASRPHRHRRAGEPPHPGAIRAGAHALHHALGARQHGRWRRALCAGRRTAVPQRRLRPPARSRCHDHRHHHQSRRHRPLPARARRLRPDRRHRCRAGQAHGPHRERRRRAVRAHRPQRPHARDHLAQAQRRPPAGDLSRHHRAQDARAGARALAQHPADRARRDAGRAPGLRRRRQVAVLQRGDAQVPQPRSRDPAAAAGRLVDPRLPDRARRLRRDGRRPARRVRRCAQADLRLGHRGLDAAQAPRAHAAFPADRARQWLAARHVPRRHRPRRRPPARRRGAPGADPRHGGDGRRHRLPRPRRAPGPVQRGLPALHAGPARRS